MSAYPKKNCRHTQNENVNLLQNKDVDILSKNDNQVSDKITTVPVNIPSKTVSNFFLINPTANNRLLSMKDDVGIPDIKDVNIPQNRDVNILPIVDNLISDKTPSVPVNISSKKNAKILLNNPTVKDRLLTMIEDVGISKEDVNIPPIKDYSILSKHDNQVYSKIPSVLHSSKIIKTMLTYQHVLILTFHLII